MLSAHVIAAFDSDLFWSRIFEPDSVFLGALWTTIYISVLAQLGGVTLGLASALAGRSRFWPLRLLNGVYVTAIRGTPLIVQIFFIYFGAELLLGVTLFPKELDVGAGVVSGAVIAGIIALALNEGAYMSEIIRAGLGSVDDGQMESAISVGMTRRQAMRKIVLPQAARIIVPPLGNQFNNMMKTTSLLSFIGVLELFAQAQQVYSTNFKPVEIFAAVAVWYLLLTTIWSIFQAYLERRLDPAGADDRGPGPFGRIKGRLRPAASTTGGAA
ncbi:MAG: amino acid ABC transporter permease [Solirubrobacteraceae bacterium]|nr:amino acid ABC transporter permease [Solirubrobacteraceae bacterium]